MRLPLDVMMVFSANPRLHGARKIITPLKDRIGAEIQTHYPRTTEEGMEITAQEAWVARDGVPVQVPPFIAELVGAGGVPGARGQAHRPAQRGEPADADLGDGDRGVERRARARWPPRGAHRPRVADVYAALPSITGKMELEYEGELQGAESIARDLIAAAARDLFDRVWDADLLDSVVEHFDTGGVLQISDGASAEACLAGLRAVPGLERALEDAGMFHAGDMGMSVAAAELLLEGLAAHRKISRADTVTYSRAKPDLSQKGKGKGGGFSFGSSDMF